MNEYIQIEFPSVSPEQKELLIAKLMVEGFDGFEETNAGLKAFIPKTDFAEESMGQIEAGISFTKTIIEEKNWNELWESNFNPVFVDDFVAVRADFHQQAKGVEHEIIITPKMSFGTGHHATTRMMMMQMREIDFKNKSALDFGTGTGVLAILAEQLGAKKILALDNDDWSIENAEENLHRNNCSRVELRKADSAFTGETYDIILANVNKTVIMENFPTLAQQLANGGVLLLSGLLQDDKDVIFHICGEYSLHLIQTTVKDNWLCLRLSC
jgi:ribosomal protein L11 methyltransferase